MRLIRFSYSDTMGKTVFPAPPLHLHAMSRFLLASLCLSLLATGARAATYHVGPERADKTLGAVLPRLEAGDVVEVDGGNYHETARLAMQGTREKPIIIRGVGPTRAVFDADGLDTEGRGHVPRGVFQIEGAYISLEHLEFRGARNGQNAAGVRLLDSTNATIRDCVVSHCDMGIFGGDTQTALIEDCEIFENGTDKFNGGSHNFYMQGNRVVVRRCYIHDALFGQNFKSRAHSNELWWNWITDSQEGEIGIVDAAGDTDKPHSNTLLVGNVISSRPERAGNNQKFVLFGSESGSSHDGTLFMFRNTCIAGSKRIAFVNLSDAKARAVISGNAFVGSPTLLVTPQTPLSVLAAHNLLPTGTALPPNWTNTPLPTMQYEDGEGAIHTVKMDEGQVAPR